MYEWVMSHVWMGHDRHSHALLHPQSSPPWAHRSQLGRRWYQSDMTSYIYEVATTSRLLKIIGLFCKRALKKRRHSAKETYDFKEPTNCSHPIAWQIHVYSIPHMYMMRDWHSATLLHPKSSVRFARRLQLSCKWYTCGMTRSCVRHDSYIRHEGLQGGVGSQDALSP